VDCDAERPDGPEVVAEATTAKKPSNVRMWRSAALTDIPIACATCLISEPTCKPADDLDRAQA
jgi:hypothetical protein